MNASTRVLRSTTVTVVPGGAVSMMIFVEKVGMKKNYVSRAIGLMLVLLGLVFFSQAFLMM